jgi:hypothetical protein
VLVLAGVLSGHARAAHVITVPANRVGVAPHARWIAVKGCETNLCSDAALLSAGQWIGLGPAPSRTTAASRKDQLADRLIRRRDSFRKATSCVTVS